MGPFVVDVSVTMAWCFRDEATHYSNAVLEALQSTYAVVPALWPFEVANALAVAERRQRVSVEGIAAFLDMLRRSSIHVERREALWLCQSILPLVRSHGLSAYDAAYLELARREDMPLATLDGDLQRASRAAGVGLVEVPPSQ